MNINELLQEKHCSCGMVHSCAIRQVRIGRNALASIPELTAGYRHILLAADDNTFALCGNEVTQLLGNKLKAPWSTIGRAFWFPTKKPSLNWKQS